MIKISDTGLEMTKTMLALHRKVSCRITPPEQSITHPKKKVMKYETKLSNEKGIEIGRLSQFSFSFLAASSSSLLAVAVAPFSAG